MQITHAPAIIRSAEGSVDFDGIYCLFDNVKRVMLERWLLAKYGMTPQQYRDYCSLPDDYPMHAPAYATEKMQMAADRIETILAHDKPQLDS